ncbi:hypothetical protein RM650_08465 [Staphylococcus epidermidis]|uniref:hypothetical protein n=1 Tax=Staphylococcus epidermidis TaxID=1282 RepID=UPI0028878DF1|nr:hypothetical protein [Staphylococcus epidermidis]MDT0742978.1 hypothetical protein [Staphylococcus epidermidis]
MKRILVLSLTAFLVLVGCNSGDKTDTKDKKEETKQTSKANKENKEQHHKQENGSKASTQLSDKERLALAFYADGVDKYMLTKNEVLTGVYDYQKGNETEKKQMEHLMLEKADSMKNAPKDMKFYQVYPSKGQFASIVGVNKNKIFIGSTQGALIDYQTLLNNGKELDISQLYEDNKDNRSLEEMKNKIEIVDSGAAQKADDPDKNSANTMAHMRSQIYQKISDFDGKLDNKTYLWDNIKINDDGNWTVHYRNHDGEIMGTYKSEKNKIIKLDQNGNKIKEQQISN